MRNLTKYPRYGLFWKTKTSKGSYYTKRKKAFLWAVDNKLPQNCLSARFVIYFAKDKKNESIEYELPSKTKEMRSHASLFTAKEEMEIHDES